MITSRIIKLGLVLSLKLTQNKEIFSFKIGKMKEILR